MRLAPEDLYALAAIITAVRTVIAASTGLIEAVRKLLAVMRR